MICEVSYGT